MQKWPPLVAGLLAHCAQGYLGFHTPGHKQGRSAWSEWRNLLGQQVFSLDLTELPGLDNLQDPQGIIREAAEAAAAYFGAATSFFLVNGTTAGILAMLLATSAPGDHVLVPRFCHQAVIHGLILSGACPFYLRVRFHPEWGLPGAVENDVLEKALLEAEVLPRVLFLIHPNYYGLVGDLRGQIELAHKQGIVVLVDEAHGAHFCTSSHFPVPALRAGADLVAQGAHKVLGAFTQAAFLHCSRRFTDLGRLRQALRMVQTSSPSYLLLASLDVARYQCSQEREEWEKLAEFGWQLRQKISQIPGLRAPGEELREVPGVVSFDPARLIINVSELGISGFEAASWLQNEHRILVEMADFQNILLILTPPDLHHQERILAACRDLAANLKGLGKRENPLLALESIPLAPQVLTPRQAFFAPREEVAVAQAVGRIAAEAVVLYPPGVPVIFPGEEITREALEYLTAWERAGGTWPGQERGTIQVVAAEDTGERGRVVKVSR